MKGLTCWSTHLSLYSAGEESTPERDNAFTKGPTEITWLATTGDLEGTTGDHELDPGQKAGIPWRARTPLYPICASSLLSPIQGAAHERCS